MFQFKINNIGTKQTFKPKIILENYATCKKKHTALVTIAI